MDAPKRIPKIGEQVIFQGYREWIEGTVKAVAFNEDGEPIRAKITWKSWAGLRKEYWAGIYDLCYFDKPGS